MGSVRIYEPGDETYLAACLRSADRRELEALSDRTPAEILREGGMNSLPSCTIVGNSGLTAGMFGVNDEGNGVGRIWLVGTDELVSKQMRSQFLRECRRYFQGMERMYRLLHNEIDERNTVHIRWLQWLGFTFIRRIPEHGVQRLPFWEFTKLCVWHNHQADRLRQVEPL
jgi:hypothetical protein